MNARTIVSFARIARIARIAACCLAAGLPLIGTSCTPKNKQPAAAPIANAASPRVARRVNVDARQPVTFVGQYAKGTQVDIVPVGGAWSSQPGGASVGAEGQAGALCLGDGNHHCIGGDGVAPLMSLVVLMTACPIEREGCFVLGRDPIPSAMSLLVPADGYLYLAPNDWMEGTADNAGALQVDVTP